MLQFKSSACRLGVMAALLSALGGCASFDFGGGADGQTLGTAGGASGGTQVVGTQLVVVTTDDWNSVLNNQSGQRLRLFVTLLGEGPLELRALPAANTNCSATATLSRRGQSSVMALDKGCTLQAQSRGEKASLLRIQTEGPKLDL